MDIMFSLFICIMYYDSTYLICRDCDGKCSGECKYQPMCFACDSSMVYDLELMSCVSSCDSSKMKISSSQYSFPSVCRLPQFYIDPLSSEIIEFGTIKFPYKSMRAASSDILNNFSNKDVNITIYLKENTDVYVSDYTNYFLNITSIKIASYSSLSSLSAKANLIPTQIIIPSTSLRTAFHLLKNMDLNISQVLSSSTFSTADLEKIHIYKATFLTAKINFYIENLNIRREVIDYGLLIKFTYLIDYQDFWFDIRNSNFNVTGTVARSFDPVNIYFDSLYIDTYALNDFTRITAVCNYPGASLSGSVQIYNITAVTTSERTYSQEPSILYYIGPANISVSNMNLLDYSIRYPNSASEVRSVSSSICVPNDGLLQTFTFSGMMFSNPNNPYKVNYNSLIHLQDQNLYRKMNTTILNATFTNMVSNFNPFIFATGNIYSELYIIDSIFKDSSTIEIVVGVNLMKKVYLSN